MFRALLQTRPEFSLFLLRIALGITLLPHGLAKLGIFVDGAPPLQESIDKTVQIFERNFGLGPVWAYLATAAEILAPIALIVGLLGRFAALAVVGTMGVAAWKTMELKAGGTALIDLPHVKWWWMDMVGQTSYGSYHILAIAVGIAILIRGSGWLSLDRAFTKP